LEQYSGHRFPPRLISRKASGWGYFSRLPEESWRSDMTSRKKTSFMRHIDAEIAADGDLRRRVKTLLTEMRSEQRLVARRERYLGASARIARQLDAQGITEKKLQDDFEKFKRRRRVAPEAAEDGAAPTSAAWRKEIARRIKDMNDPIRYVIVSAFSRRLLLYYDASSDSLPANEIAGATLFKRLAVAQAAMGRAWNQLRSHEGETAKGRVHQTAHASARDPRRSLEEDAESNEGGVPCQDPCRFPREETSHRPPAARGVAHKEPFDETVGPRRRQQCFFCDVDKSDEWNFVASLNTFAYKKCNDRISETAPPKSEAEGGS
jgi:hypothetical protein